MREKEFFEKVRDPKYDFSVSEFCGMKEPMEVICKEHGLFSILPGNMLYKGEGCKMCGIEKMSRSKSFTKQEFICKARKVHGDAYDYSLCDYKNMKTPIRIICLKCGNIFEQLPQNHLNGYGCRNCGNTTKKLSE